MNEVAGGQGSPELLVIYGSVRRHRQGIKAARFIQGECAARGHQAALVDPAEERLPLLDRMYKEFDPGPYGLFLGEVVNFAVVALALFVFIVKFLGWAIRARKEEEVAPPPPTRDQELLAEIRDLLREKRA